MTPWAWPIWTLGAWLVGFMYGNTKHCYILNIETVGLMVSGKKISFPIISPRELITPWGMANLDPRGMVGRIYVGDHQMLLHTKYISCGPHGFREEDF